MGDNGMPPAPRWRKCTPYLRPGPGGLPLVLRLSEGLGRTGEPQLRPLKFMAWTLVDPGASRQVLRLRAVRWSADAAHRRACETLTNTMPSAVCVEGAALTDLAHALVLVRPNVRAKPETTAARTVEDEQLPAAVGSRP